MTLPQRHVFFADTREMTQAQANGILDRFTRTMLNLPADKPVTENEHREAIDYVVAQTPDMQELFNTIDLVATQRRKVDRSDLKVLDSAKQVIHTHLHDDGCAEKAALALKRAILAEMKPGRNLIRPRER